MKLQILENVHMFYTFEWLSFTKKTSVNFLVKENPFYPQNFHKSSAIDLMSSRTLILKYKNIGSHDFMNSKCAF